MRQFFLDQGPPDLGKLPDPPQEGKVDLLGTTGRQIRPGASPVPPPPLDHPPQAEEAGEIEENHRIRCRQADVDGFGVISVHDPGVPTGEPFHPAEPFRLGRFDPSRFPVVGIEMDHFDVQHPAQAAGEGGLSGSGGADDHDFLHPLIPFLRG